MKNTKLYYSLHKAHTYAKHGTILHPLLHLIKDWQSVSIAGENHLNDKCTVEISH